MPIGVHIEAATGRISGTPRAPDDCNGCIRVYALAVYATNTTGSTIKIQNLDLIVASGSVVTEDGVADPDSVSSTSITPIVLGCTCGVAALVFIAVYRHRRAVTTAALPHYAKNAYADIFLDDPAEIEMVRSMSPTHRRTKSIVEETTLEVVPGHADPSTESTTDETPPKMAPVCDGEESFPAMPAPPTAAELAPWFAGAMGRRACEAAVKAAGPGDFLIRKSRGSDMFVLVVNDHEDVTSYQIVVSDFDTLGTAIKFNFGGKEVR